MSETSVINLLVADQAQNDVDHIVKTLRGEGYQIELTRADQVDEIRNAVDYQPLDLILFHPAEELPSIAELRLMVVESKQDIPIIVMMDEEGQQRSKPARLMDEGADNFFYLDDADHLVAVVRTELRHLQDRKRQYSFETRFKENESRSQALLENTQEAIAYIHEGVHAYANPAYLNLFGYTRQEDLAQIQLVHMVPPTYRDALKSVLRRSIRSGKAIEPVDLVGVRSNGQTFPILLECAPTRMNDEPCTQIIVRDATPEKNAYNRQLENLLKYDDATGLFSRRFFLETLEVDHDGTALYILFTDYASIRYAMGFEAIEKFVLEAATALKEVLALEDIAAYFASGVFTVYVPTRSPSNPLELAERIRKTIAEHGFRVNGKLFTTTCSIGVYQAQDGHENAVRILANADRACEGARQKGSNQVEIYKPPPKEERQSGSTISEQDEASIQLIRNALTKNRLSLAYQPIVSFENTQDARYKVYLQILDENEKAQALDKLGTVAVRYGLMGALDKWTLVRALSAMIELHKAGSKPPTLFVRLSRNSLSDQDFFAWLSKRFHDSQLPGHHLVLEVKETNADDCFDDTRQLRARLRELGCGLALSHFGGKAHSDWLLRELVPDYIKLDGSLIERLAKTKDENSRRAVAVLAEQAHELKIQVVASGVSTAPQMAGIWQFGVTLVQGNMVAETSSRLDFDFRQYSG